MQPSSGPVARATYRLYSRPRPAAALVALLALLLAATGGGCAARAGVPRPFPGAPLPPGAGVRPDGVEAPSDPVETPRDADALTSHLTSIVSTALSFRGVPYRNGGSDPSGFDCSGLVQYVFARHGFTLPREVRDQFGFGREVDRNLVRPGDLLFFETVRRGASHVGVAIGGDQFVHAPSSRGVVRVERFGSPYWSRRFIGARRLGGDPPVAEE